MSLSNLAQTQLDAYNAQDVAAHCAVFADDVVVANFNGAVIREGIDAYRAFHIKLFADFPQNSAKLLNRIALGGNVLDHEHVDRGNGDPPFEVVALYTFRGDKIARVDFIR